MTKNKNPDKFIKQFKGIFKKIITIPRKDVKIKIHLFLLIFSFNKKALASIPNGIASWDPKIIGAIIDEWNNDKFINT